MSVLDPIALQGNARIQNLLSLADDVKERIASFVGEIRATSFEDVLAYCSICSDFVIFFDLFPRGEATDISKLLHLFDFLKKNECVVKKLSLILCKREITAGSATALSFLLTTNQIVKLDVSNNKFGNEGTTALVWGLRKSKSLKKFYLRGASLYDKELKLLSESLKENTQLEDLILSDNKFTGEGFASLMRAVQQNLSLKRLDMQGNFVDLNSCKEIGNVLLMNRCLTELVLNNCLLTVNHYDNDPVVHECWKLIGDGLKANKTLKHLSLNFTKVKIEYIAEALRFNKTLKFLSVCGVELSNEELKMVAYMLLQNTALIDVNLEACSEPYFQGSTNDIAEGSEELAMALSKNSTVKYFHFSVNSVLPRGAEKFGYMLRLNASLLHLDLVSCNIGARGADAIGTAMKTNKVLKKLELAYNGIGNEGAISLANGLKMNVSLTKLGIEMNDINSTEAFRALAHALKVNMSLRQLCLRKNDFGDEGAKSIADLLGSNTSLQSLDCALCSIQIEGAICIANAIKSHNRTLRTIYISDNMFGFEGVRLIQEACKENGGCTISSRNGSEWTNSEMINWMLSPE